MMRGEKQKSGVGRILKKIKKFLTENRLNYSDVSTRFFITLAVFVVLFASSIYYWNNSRQSVNHDIRAQFSRSVDLINGALDKRLDMYKTMLDNTRGLLHVASDLSQPEWQQYFNVTDVNQQLPDVLLIGYAPLTSGGLIVNYQANFSSGASQLAGQNLMDSSSSPYIDKAIAGGTIIAGGQLADIGKTKTGLFLYKPVYLLGQPLVSPSERRQNLQGVMVMEVNTATLFEKVLSGTMVDSLGMQVYDGGQSGASNRLYISSNYSNISNQSGTKSKTDNFTFYGQNWTIDFIGSANMVSANERDLPLQILLRGILASVFFAAMVWYLVSSREHKIMQQQEQQIQLAKDDLLSLASHQLRTPATVVKQYVGMLLEGYGGKITPKQRDMLANAYENNERQLAIITKLLYVARLNAGRIVLNKQKINLNDLIVEAAAAQLPTIKASGQRLIKKIPKRPVMIEADQSYLPMVFENLLSNAHKYTPAGGRISILLKQDKAHNTAIVIVEDNGLGIPKKDFKNIFEKFSRSENEYTSDISGSGIGLYLADQLARLHGGKIAVESVEGHGSKFTVYLPMS